MNLYETVKGRVTPQMAAERYGLPVNRGGMACCPFHDDRKAVPVGVSLADESYWSLCAHYSAQMRKLEQDVDVDRVCNKQKSVIYMLRTSTKAEEEEEPG